MEAKLHAYAYMQTHILIYILTFKSIRSRENELIDLLQGIEKIDCEVKSMISN